MSEKEKCLLDIMLDNTSSCCPVRPHNTFDLNYSTGLSALGLCLTYVIVLIQFRISEPGEDSENSSSFTMLQNVTHQLNMTTN